MLEVIFTKEAPKAGIVRLVPMFETAKKAAKVDCLSVDEGRLVKKAIQQSGFGAKAKENISIFGGRAKIILAGLGNVETPLALQQAGAEMFALLKEEEKAYIAAGNDTVALNLAYGLLLGSYSFDKYKTEKKSEDFPRLEQIIVRTDNPEDVKEAFKECLAVVTGVRYCKDLCNEPANYLTPEVFAADIKRLEYLGLEVEILTNDEIKTRGLGLIEATAKGSVQEPKVVVVSWSGNRHQQAYDLGLVGKGVCFDAGGLSLKSTPGMVEMKMDMAGAAAVVALMKTIALRRLRKNVVAVIGLVENMPGAAAMKIGDIYTAANGKTVEIMNTDAEGRLVSADCLAYMQQNFEVKKVVVLATLGALKNVLGSVYAGLFTNDEKMAKSLIKAGETTGEKLWRMPLDEAYGVMLASKLADMRNVAVDNKASIVSAAFLSRFIEKGVKWAHIDISGVRLDKGLTSGFGVKLLNEFVKEL